MQQKANKKTVIETKKNNLFSTTLTKRPTVITNSAQSSIQNSSAGKEIPSKSTKNGEGFVYKGVVKCKRVISVDNTDFTFQKYFSSLSENNLLINFEIQSRRKRKKALFFSNLESKSLNSDRTVSNSNSVKLFNLYMSNKCLIKQEIALIQKDQSNDAKCIYVFVLNPHLPNLYLNITFGKIGKKIITYDGERFFILYILSGANGEEVFSLTLRFSNSKSNHLCNPIKRSRFLSQSPYYNLITFSILQYYSSTYSSTSIS
jgi:hypothetical protein